MPKLRDLKRKKYPNILLYGPLGSGKTIFALTLGERAQVWDFDDGLESGMNVQDEFTDFRQCVDVVQFLEKEPEKRANAFIKCKAHAIDVANKARKGNWNFDAIIVDSLTSMVHASLNQVLSNANHLGKNPQIQHWGLAFIELKMVLSVIRSIPVPKIVIGHDMQKNMNREEGKEDDWRTMIALPGVNLPTEISALFDEVWYMRAKQTGGGKRRYEIQTLGSDKLDCRSRKCLENMTNTNVGAWEILKKLGHTVEEPIMT